MRHDRYRAGFLAAFWLFVASGLFGQSQGGADAGSALLKSGDYKGAESFYRKVLAESPQSPEALSNLGIALQMQGKSSEAIASFQAALTYKQMPLTSALLAEEKCKTRDLDGARPIIDRILKKDPNDASLLAAIAPCILELGEPIESVRVYTSLLDYRPYPTDLALIQLSKSYLKTAQFFFGRLSQAQDGATYIEVLRDARDKGSSDARGAFDAAAKASPYFEPDLDFYAAVARWREHPQDTALLYLLEVLSTEQSMRQIEICDQSYPDSPYLAQLKAEIFANQGHDDEAVTRYETLMQIHPELPNLLYDLGMLFRKEREWDKALAVFQKQLAKDPDDERSAARISESMIQLGRWKDISDFLSPRIQKKNAPLWAMLDLAEASQNLDDPKRAIVVLVNAERSNSSEKVVHWRLMQLYRMTGNTAQYGKELTLFRALSK